MSKTKKILDEHSTRRAEQHYGITLNHDDRRELVKQIQEGDAEFVSRTSNRCTLWKVDHEGTKMNVVYDKARHTLSTVLPKTAWEFQGPQAQVSCSITPSTTTGSTPTQQSSDCIECREAPCQCPGNWTDYDFSK